MADIFISYKREDKQIAERLSIALEQLGFDVWWDMNLISGQPYRSAIRAVIDQCKAAIVLWSDKSVQSEFVMDEASYAHRLGKLCPARIDGVELPMGFGQTHTADLVGWDGETNHRGFQNVVSAVETRVGRKGRLGASARTTEAEAGAAELEAFKTAQYAGTAQALNAFLKHFPRGMFANFVRGQLETMEVSTPQAAAANARAETPPRESPRSTPSYESPSSRVAPAHESSPKKSPPWALIAGALAVVAIFAALFALRPQQTQTAQEPAPQSTEVEAADGEERDQAASSGLDPEVETAQQAERGRTAAAPQSSQQRQVATPNYDAYDLAQLHPQVRAAVEQARENERQAIRVGARARSAATRAQEAAQRAANNEPGTRLETDGSRRTEGDYANGAFNGYAVQTYFSSVSEQYSGQISDGYRHGYGVYVNAQGGRIESEWRRNSDNGRPAIRYYGSGENGAGSRFFGPLDTFPSGPGVEYDPTGNRFEGEFVSFGSGLNGYGVKWNSQGRLSQQGIWRDNQLVTPLSR